MTSPRRPADAVLLAAPADALAADFANTRYWRGSKAPTETLTGPDALLGWAGEAALVPSAALDAIRAAWRARPAAGDEAFAAALAWREAIFRSLAAVSRNETPAAADIALLNAALDRAPSRRRLVAGPEGAGWEVDGLDAGAPALLAPVLWSAGDLLLGPRRARVRQCANPACGYLFIDDSKTGNRRWCAMSACGNRAKAHRHYLKRKAAEQGTDPTGAPPSVETERG
ncbi:MAG: CGNR zinc finger domain-containing protein [Proteobacteria bacterium]|nr:CGNR zinc finger domain-containing protein [Pseudomonadota bacterium]